ncbi:hypothetical protein MKW92_015898 [Papaver armeniacum]|nr:hypothetical protein MKW92_015898 [Papaver armeniacum]
MGIRGISHSHLCLIISLANSNQTRRRGRSLKLLGRSKNFSIRTSLLSSSTGPFGCALSTKHQRLIRYHRWLVQET